MLKCVHACACACVGLCMCIHTQQQHWLPIQLHINYHSPRFVFDLVVINVCLRAKNNPHVHMTYYMVVCCGYIIVMRAYFNKTGYDLASLNFVPAYIGEKWIIDV